MSSDQRQSVEKKKLDFKSYVSALVLLAVPKCGICTLLFGGGIAICGGSAFTESMWFSAGSIFLLFSIAVYKHIHIRMLPWQIIMVAFALLLMAFSEFILGQSLLYYVGSIYFLIGMIPYKDFSFKRLSTAINS